MQTLALVAHDHKKADLVAGAAFNRGTLAAFRLVATRHTARLLRDKVGLEVAQPHDPDIRALLRVCNVHNVPLATNLATADLMISALPHVGAAPDASRRKPAPVPQAPSGPEAV